MISIREDFHGAEASPFQREVEEIFSETGRLSQGGGFEYRAEQQRMAGAVSRCGENLVARYPETSPAAHEHFARIVRLLGALASEAVRFQILARGVAVAQRVPHFLSPSGEPGFERAALQSDAGRGETVLLRVREARRERGHHGLRTAECRGRGSLGRTRTAGEARGDQQGGYHDWPGHAA